LNVY